MTTDWSTVKHYLSEIVGGALFGGFGGLLVGPALLPLADSEAGFLVLLPLYFTAGALIGGYAGWRIARTSK